MSRPSKSVSAADFETGITAMLNSMILVHVLAGHLILHKRTLEPIKTMIFGLRRYDVDRCAALIDMSDPANENAKVVGYMSHKSKIYLVSHLLNPSV